MALKIIVLVILTILAGAIWRRLWGSPTAAWWPVKRDNGDGVGYRAFQAVVGFAALGVLLHLIGAPWIKAAYVSLIALGFLSTHAQSIPHIWAFWDWVERKAGLPGIKILLLYGGERHSTTYAEATAGGVVWFLATLAVL